MKIITWNCNLNLRSKFENLNHLSPDIAIIQECEKLDENFFPNAQYFWLGKNESKGLGVIIFNKGAKKADIVNQDLVYFLPIQTDLFNIMGVWAYNHRASQKFGENISGNTSDAINYYESWLSSNSKSIFAGDFNNSTIWDKGNKENNFKNINKRLNQLHFTSSYHTLTSEEFGSETKGTLFHTKNRDKSYFIDYIYAKGMKIENIDIGNYDDWISLSDHMPVIANFN